MNPEVAPKHWTEGDEQDHCANVEWSECVFFGMIAAFVIVGGFVLWIVGEIVMSMVVWP